MIDVLAELDIFVNFASLPLRLTHSHWFLSLIASEYLA